MVAHSSTTISPSSSAGATAPESLLARQIIENVTGFFSILHECRVPKIPAPGMIAGSDWRRCGMARHGCRLRKLGRSAVAVLRAGRTHVGAQFDERDRYRR